MGALILWIWDAVAIAVFGLLHFLLGNAFGGAPIGSDRPFFVRAVVIGIGHAIFIGIAATHSLGIAWNVGAFVVAIDNAIPVAVLVRIRCSRTFRAAGVFRHAFFVGAVVFKVGQTVFIGIPAAVEFRAALQAWAFVFFIHHPIVVPVGASFSGDRPANFGASIFEISHAVFVFVRAAVGVGYTCHVGAAVKLVGNAVSVGIGASHILLRASLAGASVVLICEAVFVAVFAAKTVSQSNAADAVPIIAVFVSYDAHAVEVVVEDWPQPHLHRKQQVPAEVRFYAQAHWEGNVQVPLIAEVDAGFFLLFFVPIQVGKVYLRFGQACAEACKNEGGNRAAEPPPVVVAAVPQKVPFPNYRNFGEGGFKGEPAVGQGLGVQVRA